MCFPVSLPRLRDHAPTLVASLTLLASGALFAQSATQGEVDALKAQMERMQKQYEDRISNMESQMKSLESKAQSGTILNTRILTDENGTAVAPSGPTLDEAFLKTLTRNFQFAMYARVGVLFNQHGGGAPFSFNLPDNDGGRPRLGNENDMYMEPTWIQKHILGDSPDVANVTFWLTPQIAFNHNRATAIHTIPNASDGDFNWSIREAYSEMKNVFKGAPEITFWGGARFYDRWNVDPNDYFYLDDSGYGAGVHDIDLGFGKLWLAYFGGQNDNFVSNDVGAFYKHTFDAIA